MHKKFLKSVSLVMAVVLVFTATFIIDAGAGVHDVNEYLPFELPQSSDYDTIAGLVSHVFDKIPDVGETTEEFGYRFTIMKKTQQNIEYVKLDVVEETGDEDSDS